MTLYPKPIEDLIELFATFPGIGPRQAARFVFHLLRERDRMIPRMQSALDNMKNSVLQCAECYRTMERVKGESRCAICRDQKRGAKEIAVVEKESDMHGIEKTGAFAGRYHILGGTISPLDSDSPARLHLKELYARVSKVLAEHQSAEIILATSATTEGDMTALYIDRILTPLRNQYPELRVTRLGRGLSSGAELEYADPDTLKNAFLNRK